VHRTLTLARAVALIAGLSLAGGAAAQKAPSGGPDAKGNAPIKHVHTINDGSAKGGANSFTQQQARKHILNSGYADVSALTKGTDGVWRGTASKGGATVNVALDFKGNISEGGPAGPAPGISARATTPSAPANMEAYPPGSQHATSSPADEQMASMHYRRHHRHHHHHWRARHAGARCADPGPNGVACSGRDRNRNGISDKEDRARSAGAKP
jgi:hypothetical protein